MGHRSRGLCHPKSSPTPLLPPRQKIPDNFAELLSKLSVVPFAWESLDFFFFFRPFKFSNPVLSHCGIKEIPRDAEQGQNSRFLQSSQAGIGIIVLLW